uniref:Uncharacterized protein n=1 Tax=Macrostomum lignano TaxID=282301 RepID=A0A1I8I5V8_9PLAT
MNVNCPPPELPDMNRLCRMDFCQACDLFPVDMGIDVGPLQARINECKRRYHREVWKILCDGVDGIEDQEAGAKDGKSGAVKESDRSARGGAGKAKFAGAGRPGFGHLELDGDRRDGRAVRNQEDFEDILKDLDARTEDTTKKRENRNNKSRPPPRKLNNQSNSTDSPASSSRRRPRSRSVGGVPASGNATKDGMAWLPIQAELQKLRSSLAAAAALAATATAATKSCRRNKTRSDDFDDSKGDDGEKDIGELVEETTLTGESRSEPQRGQTLVSRESHSGRLLQHSQLPHRHGDLIGPNANIQLRSDGRNCSETSHCTEVSHHHNRQRYSNSFDNFQFEASSSFRNFF